MRWSIPVIWILFAATISLAQQAAIEQIRQEYAQGNYQPAILRISTVLADSGARLTPAQRYELFLTKAECLVQLGQPSYASRDFLDAARLAPDRKKAVEARAYAAVTKRSSSAGYRPRRDGAEPIPLTAPETRKKAVAAAFDDLLRESKPKMEEAIQADNLLPIRNLLQVAYDLYSLEVVSTGASAQVDPTFDALGTKAGAVVSEAASQLGEQIEWLHARATRLRLSQYGYSGSVNYGGLNSTERRNLRGLIEDVEQMQAIAQLAINVAKDFGRSGQRWTAIAEQVNGILKLARDTAAIDYADD